MNSSIVKKVNCQKNNSQKLSTNNNGDTLHTPPNELTIQTAENSTGVLRETAARYYNAGLNVLPAIKAQKRPALVWRQYVVRKPDFQEVFPPTINFDALCVVCGATSGGLEIIDFDQKGEKFTDWAQSVQARGVDILKTCVIESTQSGGVHVGYRCSTFGNNRKLAKNSKGVTIETRGAGGICLVAPSPGYVLTGSLDWADVPTIDEATRAIFFEAAKELDETPPEPYGATSRRLEPRRDQKVNAPIRETETPADYLRRTGQIRESLKKAGWIYLSENEEWEQWRRPEQTAQDKPGGSINKKDGFFHCFTSNGEPFEEGGSYSPLQVVALLDFGGDERAAAKHWNKKRGAVCAPNAERLSAVPITAPTLDAPPVDLDEELNRAAKLARIEREQELEEQATKRDLALYTDPFPEELLPLSIDKLATSYANKYHLPKASIVFTQLATVGAFLGTKFSFYTPELWEESCYAKIGLLGVAPSGSYKSPIFKLCTRPLKEITAQFATEYQAKLKAAKQKRNEIKCIKGNIKQLEGFIKTRRGDKTAETIAEIKDFRTRIKELERRLDSIDIEETFDPPEPPKFLISGTPEGVLKRVAYNTKNGYTNGAVMGTDEGLRVLSLSGGVDKALEKFFKYTEVLDGTTADNETSTTESTGDYNIPGEKFTGTLFFIQPGPFARCLRKKELVEQGFLNRFIKVYIPYIEECESREPVRHYELYKQIFDECLTAPSQQFTLSPKALNVAYNWKDKIKQEQNKANRRNDEVSAAFLGKLQILFISFVTSIHYCDAIDRKEGAYRQCGEFVTPTDIIDVETVERAIKLVEAAAEYTQACNRYLDECIEEAEAPKKQRKENAVENRVLEIISNAGRQGATIKTLQEKINFLRGKVGKRRAEKILEIFRNAGEIEKHGARYYVATLPESLDDLEGGAE